MTSNHIKISLLITLVQLLSSTFATAQDENIKYEDWIYENNIKTVQFHPIQQPFDMPVYNLRLGRPLIVSFDDLNDDYKDFVYTVEHCNQNWEPSNIPVMNYLAGFGEEEFEDFDYSFETAIAYTHYWATIPNRDFRILISGNYLLKVYEDETDKKLAFTRRFVVTEEFVQVEGLVTRGMEVEKSRTHQEVDFRVIHEDLEMRNPMRELSATVVQNGNWQTAVHNIPPRFSRQGVQEFDHQNKVVFYAGKEFRFADLTNFDIAGNTVLEVVRTPNDISVTLIGEEKRATEGYFTIFDDVNGKFTIQANDGLRNQAAELEAEYADVLFTLKSETEYHDEDVYIYGGLTDWQFKDEFKMVYNPALNGYVGKALLKQGVYDYVFAVKPKDSDIPDLETTEGTWWEAENDYWIFVYYRPFGGRFDRVIGARRVNSVR